MDQSLYRTFVRILREELIPAMGCTEPIAVAYAAALARKTLGVLPEGVDIRVSANIIKNVKSVVVPHTGGLRGIAAAAAAGIVAGRPERELQVLSEVSQAEIAAMADYLEQTPIAVGSLEEGYLFDIQVRVRALGHRAFVRISGTHTNVVRVERDDTVLLSRPYTQDRQTERTDRNLLSVERIVEFADCVKMEDVQEILDRQIALNTAIAE